MSASSFRYTAARLPRRDDEPLRLVRDRVSAAASLLDDKVLDASVEHNQIAFTIADQVEE
jgi:hypothetical protein